MQYLYHKVPKDLQDNVLYPLNELKQRYPSIYRDEINKYKNREHITKQTIPLFNNCLWNDVVFLTAVNPVDLYEARREAGWPDLPPQRFFQIDPTTLDQSKLGIFLFTPKEHSAELASEDFTSYHYKELHKYTEVPLATRNYFKSELQSGSAKIPLFFRYVPHILYYGAIDTTNAKIITVN